MHHHACRPFLPAFFLLKGDMNNPQEHPILRDCLKRIKDNDIVAPRRNMSRPEGTDGSDYSYRQVIDNRYAIRAAAISRLQLASYAHLGCAALSGFELSTKETFDVLILVKVVMCLVLAFLELTAFKKRIKASASGACFILALAVSVLDFPSSDLYGMVLGSEGGLVSPSVINTCVLVLANLVSVWSVSVLLSDSKSKTKKSK